MTDIVKLTQNISEFNMRSTADMAGTFAEDDFSMAIFNVVEQARQYFGLGSEEH